MLQPGFSREPHTVQPTEHVHKSPAEHECGSTRRTQGDRDTGKKQRKKENITCHSERVKHSKKLAARRTQRRTNSDRDNVHEGSCVPRVPRTKEQILVRSRSFLLYVFRRIDRGKSLSRVGEQRFERMTPIFM